MNTADEATPLLAPRFPWFSQTVAEGVRFWERGRLAYNGIQLLLTAIMFAVRWPESHFLYTSNLGSYFGFAVIANILYSVAYIPEAILQIPHLRPFARRTRLVILIAGTVLACYFTSVVLDFAILCDPSND